MAHVCPDCDRSFVEEYLLANHGFAVHLDQAGEDDLAIVTSAMKAYLGTKGDDLPQYLSSIFALDTTAPERKRIVEISGEPGNFQTKVVSDYNTIVQLGEEIKQVSDKLAGVKQVGRPDDLADSDDTPEAQQYLMQAWQAMALYLANADDEDQAGAMQVLKSISNLMSDQGEPNQPLPTGAFGTTSMAKLDMAAGNTFDCPQCKRTFSTEQGLINHLKQVHAAREKETKMKTESD